MTQVALASSMGVSQAQVAKVERQADLYVSTLRRFIEAMGGELEFTARFPNGEVVGVSLAESPEGDGAPVTKSPVGSHRVSSGVLRRDG